MPAVDVCTGELDSLILPQVNTSCMQLFVNEVSKRHPDKYIVMVIDGAGWHRSGMLKAPSNIYLFALGLKTLEKNPETVRTIVSWDWIVSSLITSFMK